jgi:hypothetical protein
MTYLNEVGCGDVDWIHIAQAEYCKHEKIQKEVAAA